MACKSTYKATKSIEIVNNFSAKKTHSKTKKLHYFLSKQNMIRNILISASIFALFANFASASCPSGCSGHGTCGVDDLVSGIVISNHF